MKTVSIREVQHNLAKVLRRVEGGEEIDIVRHNRPVARLLPARTTGAKTGNIDWSDLDERLEKVWHTRQSEGISSDELLEDLRGDR